MAVRPRAKSVQKVQAKGKGKGKSYQKKPGKAAIVICSDSEESSGEVDFPHLPPNQPVNLPAEEPEEPNQPLDIPAEEPGEPEEPNNPNPLPDYLPRLSLVCVICKITISNICVSCMCCIESLVFVGATCITLPLFFINI